MWFAENLLLRDLYASAGRVPPKISNLKMSTPRMSTPEISTPKMSTFQNVNFPKCQLPKFQLLKFIKLCTGKQSYLSQPVSPAQHTGDLINIKDVL